MPNQSLIKQVQAQIKNLESLAAPELLKALLNIMGDELVLAHSLSREDCVIGDMLYKINPKFTSFTLDTGRLNPETYDLLDRLQEKYSLNIDILSPDNQELEAMVKKNGINLFYKGLDERKLCCKIRKVNPLNKILKKYSAWVCGLRTEQSETRQEIQKIEIDSARGMLKINPLKDWSFEQVETYIKDHNIPSNKLYAQGYRSIGCAPCTRAIGPNDHERAGRWWWEDPDKKECGLHV